MSQKKKLQPGTPPVTESPARLSKSDELSDADLEMVAGGATTDLSVDPGTWSGPQPDPTPSPWWPRPLPIDPVPIEPIDPGPIGPIDPGPIDPGPGPIMPIDPLPPGPIHPEPVTLDPPDPDQSAT
jgi:hypothetical protein